MTSEERFMLRLARARARYKRKQERLARIAEKKRLRAEKQALYFQRQQERKVAAYKRARARERIRVLRARIRLTKLRLSWLSGGPYSRVTSFQRNELRSTWYNADGTVLSDYTEAYPSMISLDHDRTGHSANPIRALPSYPGTLWRNPSNYSRFSQSVEYTPATFSWVDSEGRVRLVESGHCIDPSIVNYGPHLFYGPNIVTQYDLFARASTECLLKLKDQKVALGENIATLKDTIRMVSSNAAQLARAIYYAKRGKWSKVSSSLGLDGRALASGKTLANRWLEYQYGWKPLMSDIHAGIELIKNSSNKAFLISATRRIKDKRTDLQPSSGWVTKVSGFSDISCQFKCYAAIDDERVHLLNQIGLLNPLEVAWELVPYSFVIDWFLPVGNFLQALNATAGLNFIGGSVTWRVESEISQDWRRPHPFSGLSSNSVGTVTTRSFAINRQMLTSFPAPLPYTKNPFSTGHLLNAIALIRGAIR